MIGLDAQVHRKSYRSPATLALEDLHFRVEPGEFVAIVGPSGAGKTTLLNLVSGLDPELDGEVRLLGATASAESREAIRLGIVFQQPRLMPWLTILENVCLVLEDCEAERARARSLLADIGLQEFADAFPAQLSGGMQRRAALTRAFAVQPDLLLMDEPFLSLDAPTAWRLREQLMALWDAHRPTVLYVTHDLREALSLAGRVLFLSQRPGRVILDYSVDVKRPRGPTDPRVTQLHEQLLTDYPQLLSGVADAGEQPSATTLKPRALP